MFKENNDFEKYAPGCIPERQRDRNMANQMI